VIVVPGAAAPGKLGVDGLVAVTVIVKSDSTAVPPLSLIKSLITVRDAVVGTISLLVIVHTMTSPAIAVSAHDAVLDSSYPAGPASATLYAPGSIVIVVPGAAAPGKLGVDGLVAVTVIVKSDSTAVPPLSLIKSLITVRDAVQVQELLPILLGDL